MGLLLFAAAYILLLNLIGFAICGIDKSRAKNGGWRISERALLLTGLCGGCFGVLLGMRVFRHKTKHLKFRVIVPLECVLWAIAVIHIASALTLDRQIQYLEISYPSTKISEVLDGYTIAFVTDTHALPAEDLHEVVNRINGYVPDLLLLGGDFPSADGAPARSMEILSGVNATDGIYGVEGNHDDYAELFAAMENHGATPLSNSGTEIREGFYLAGVEDLWNRQPDIAAATEGADSDDFVLLLSHNPDVAMRQETENVDLILSGHTHGGYVTLFGTLAPALAWSDAITGYSQRFLSGWAESRDGTDVFVSNGTGYFAAVPRVFARPQVILLTLESIAEKEENAEYRKIAPENAKEMIDGGNVTILDVRTQEEYNERHIADAILIPDYDIEAFASEVLPDKGATILVYCRTGIPGYADSWCRYPY